MALTPTQEGMLFHYLTESNSEQYFEQVSLRIEGNVEFPIFRKAWELVVKDNEVLRTIFRWEGLEKPIQIVLKEYQIPWKVFDFNGLSETEIDRKLAEVRNNDRQDKLNISLAPLRLIWCNLGQNQFELIISNHHILFDGWSTGIILKELLQAYTAQMQPEKTTVTVHALTGMSRPLKNKFKEFVKWSQKQDSESSNYFWRKNLAGFEVKTELPFQNRKPELTLSALNYSYKLPDILQNQLHTCCKQYGITLATLLYSAWGVLLQRYSNTDDVVFGTTVSGRNPEIPGIEYTVGLFINTIPLRITTKPEITVSDLLTQVNDSIKERSEFDNTPLVDIKRVINFTYGAELFDSIMVIENYPLDKLVTEMGSEFHISGYTGFSMTNFPLTVTVTVFEASITLNIAYYPEMFGDETIRRMTGHLVHLLQDITGPENKLLNDLELLDQEEKERLSVGFQGTNREYPINVPINQLFEEQAAKIPDQIALTFEAQPLSYRELNIYANRVAWYLKQKGFAENDVIGVMLERSFELIIGILGIIKAGQLICQLIPTIQRSEFIFYYKIPIAGFY